MTTLVSDHDLMAAAQGGDAQAFAALVRTHVPRLHRYLVATGVSHHDADDLVQDAFLRVHRNLDRYDPRYAFTTWLYTIAHRLRLNWTSRKRVHAALDSVPEPHRVDAPTVSGEESELDGTWLVARQILSPRHFQLLWLRYGEDLELEAIASICTCTTLNVRVSLHRARTKLEYHLRSAGFAPTPARGTP